MRSEIRTGLHEAGAHFVRLNEKKPINNKWQKRPLSLEDALVEKTLGVIPASVGLLILDLDVDKGAPEDLRTEERERHVKETEDLFAPAAAIIKTPSGGVHMVYRKPNGYIRPGHWKYGDVRVAGKWLCTTRPNYWKSCAVFRH